MIQLVLAVVLAAPPSPSRPASPALADPQARASQVSPGTAAQDPIAEAYFQFLVGRNREARGDVDGAIAAYRQAMTLDPASAEIPAELAGLFARQSRLREAIDMAAASLKLNPKHGGAHLVLGSVYAELGNHDEGRGAAATAGEPSNTALAIEHLEAAREAEGDDMPPGPRLTLGRLYLKQGDYAKGITTLRDLLTDEPYLPQAVTLLAQAYTEAGRNGEAIDLLRGAVDEDPDFYSALGEAYEKGRRWPEAASAYAKALEANPDDQDLKVRWAVALLTAGGNDNATKARDLLRDVTRRNPTNGWPLYLLTQAERATGDLDAAEQNARKLLVIAPGRPWGAHALAQVLEQRREFAKIVEALEPLAAKTAPGRESDTALILTHLGFAYQELGRFDQAIAAFERARTLDPGDASFGRYLVQALLAAKQYDRALTVVREQRQKDAANVGLARFEAEALRGSGKVAEGEALLKGLIKPDAADPDAALALSEYYASVQRYPDAARVLEDLTARFPDNLDLLFQYGAMLERQKQVAEAEKVFRAVLAKDPQHAPTLNYLGYMLADRGEHLQESLALIQRAIAIDPYNGAYLDSLGWAYFRMNQLDLAEKHLKAAADQLPRDSAVQEHLGDLLYKRGRYSEAIMAWQRALAGDGESVDRVAIDRKVRDAQSKAR